MHKKINSYKDLIVWQKSIDLIQKIYFELTNFPNDEKFGLISQMKRSSISIASNIAEGFGQSSKNYSRYLRIARGSLHELETQYIIAKRLDFMNKNKEIESLMDEIGKMLSTLIHRIEKTNPKTLLPKY